MATFSGKGRASSSSLLAPSHSTLCRAPVPKRLSLVPLDPGQVQLFPLLVPRSFLETAQSGPASLGMPANSPILQFVAWGDPLPGSERPATQAGKQGREAFSVTFGSLGSTQNQ